MFGQGKPRFASATCSAGTERRPIVLVSLGQRRVSDRKAPALMGSDAPGADLAGRSRSARRFREASGIPSTIYLDEIQEIVRLGDLADALAMARGYGGVLHA